VFRDDVLIDLSDRTEQTLGVVSAVHTHIATPPTGMRTSVSGVWQTCGMRVPLVILMLLAVLWLASEVAYPNVLRVAPTWWFSCVARKGGIFLDHSWYDPTYFHDVHNPPDYWSCGITRPSPSGGFPRKWLPEVHTWTTWPDQEDRGIVLPLWPLMLPFVVWVSLVCMRRRRMRGLCPCGYNARGLDVCPECGRDAKA